MAPPKGKGKDLRRMSAPPAPAPAPAAPAPNSTSASTPSQQPASGVVASSPSPRGNKPKGKDFGRMQPPPAPAAAVAVQPPPVVPVEPSTARTAFGHSENVRRQNSARLAAGMPPIMQNPLPVQNPMTLPAALPRPSYAQMPQQPQHQPQRQSLAPNSNAPPHLKQRNQRAVPVQTQKKSQLKQPPIVPQINASTKISSTTKNVSLPSNRPSWAEANLSTMEHMSNPTTPHSKKKIQDDHGKASLAPILGEKLQKLCHSIDPSYTLDAEVQERLVEMADSFVDKVTKDAIKLARHRGSARLDVVDMAVALKKGYNIEIPGLGPPSVASGSKGGQVIGGWLFADRGEQPKKKRKASETATATTASM